MSKSLVLIALIMCIIVNPCDARDGNHPLISSESWFWHQAFRPAVVAQAPEQIRLCTEVEDAAAKLPSRNSVVQQMLKEAADHLRRANVALLAEATRNSASKLHRKLPSTYGEGHGAFQTAVRSFAAMGAGSSNDEAADRLAEELSRELEADKKPAGLRGFIGAQEQPTDAVGECRHVSKLGFEVLKYDIRHEGVPKTPAVAQSLAKNLIDAAAKTRRTWYQFMSHVDGLSSPWGAGAHFLPSTPQPAKVEADHAADVEETIISS